MATKLQIWKFSHQNAILDKVRSPIFPLTRRFINSSNLLRIQFQVPSILKQLTKDSKLTTQFQIPGHQLIL